MPHTPPPPRIHIVKIAIVQLNFQIRLVVLQLRKASAISDHRYSNLKWHIGSESQLAFINTRMYIYGPLPLGARHLFKMASLAVVWMPSLNLGYIKKI